MAQQDRDTYRNNYRELLRQHLTSRCGHNPRYSLRAFARDLKVSPSRVSEILSGKQGLSLAAARDFSQHLGLNQSETQYFCDLVEASHGRSQSARQLAMLRLRKYEDDSVFREFKDDTFRFIADWYHMAILQLTYLDAFKPTVPWIAKALNISDIEASQGLDRMERLGLIKRSRGKIQAVVDVPIFRKDTPSEPIKKFHKQVMEKAIQALFLQGIEERENSAVLVSTNAQGVGLIKQMIRDFSKEVVSKLNQSAFKNDTVYTLAIQFFRLSERDL